MTTNKTPKRIGQPPKLTPEVELLLVQAIITGMSYRMAAAAAGVSCKSEQAWRDRGERAAALEESGQDVPESEHRYLSYFRAVQRARAEAVQARLNAINEASAEGHWQAAAWWLERMFPHDYGRKQTVTLTGEEGAPIKVEVDHKASLMQRLGLTDAGPES